MEKVQFNELAQLLRIAAKSHFWAFCNHMDYDFFQKRKILKEAAIMCDDLAHGRIQKGSISMPPRFGKSYLASLLAAFIIGLYPTLTIMRNCGTARLYRKFSYMVRSIIQSQKYREIFPHVIPSRDNFSVDGWYIEGSTQGTYFGAGVGGQITGFPATAISMTDDLYKGHDAAMSETIRDKTDMWLQSEHKSRLERNPYTGKECPQLDIGTRWLNEDVIGKRMSSGFYDRSIVIPALDENGETTCEDVKSTEDYQALKRETDLFIWLSEYMQTPMDAEGLVFPISELKRFDKANDGGITLAYIDTADEGEDYLSMPIMKFYVETMKGYVIDVVFNRDNLTMNESLINSKIKEHGIDYVMVETNKEGSFFLNGLRRGSPNTKIMGIHNVANKLTRVLAQSGWVKEHLHFLQDYEHHEDYNRFMKNLTTYLRTGTSKNDDAPDSTAGLAAFARKILKL